MALFYVPVVLIVHSEKLEDVDGEVESFLEGLLNLRLEKIDGYTLVTGLASSPASENWVEQEQRMAFRGGEVTVVEFPLGE